ncbi:MAG TPA: molybdopterin-guanine dinucleotide biosynthesis protein B [Bacillota bacterium]|nr:molybdopterin-guanine dinucleotide biosynthesis protein B [Bacillota bacterium]
MKKTVPVIGLAGYSGAGKTTFMEKLIAELKSRGYRTGVIKHTHHPVEFDRPGKDTWRHARAGADTVVLAAPGGVALYRKFEREPAPEQVAAMIEGVDIILVEGYKSGHWPKIEICNGRTTERPEIPRDELLAVVGGGPVSEKPCFGPDDAAGVADFIEGMFLKKR